MSRNADPDFWAKARAHLAHLVPQLVLAFETGG